MPRVWWDLVRSQNLADPHGNPHGFFREETERQSSLETDRYRQEIVKYLGVQISHYCLLFVRTPQAHTLLSTHIGVENGTVSATPLGITSSCGTCYRWHKIGTLHPPSLPSWKETLWAGSWPCCSPEWGDGRNKGIRNSYFQPTAPWGWGNMGTSHGAFLGSPAQFAISFPHTSPSHVSKDIRFWVAIYLQP